MGSSEMLRRGRQLIDGLPSARLASRPLSRGSRSTATGAAAALSIMLLAGCADKPVVVVADAPLCTITSRPQITEAQRAAFRADQATWESLVDWLASFLKVRDATCLKPVAGQ